MGQWAEHLNNVKHFTKVCIETLAVLEKAMTAAFGDDFDILSEMVLDDSLNETGMVLGMLEPEYYSMYKSPMSDASKEQQGEKSPDDELV
jgi:hypothetical protein